MRARAQIYPMQAEREYARLTRTIYNKVVRAMTPRVQKIMKLYDIETRTDSRFDSGTFRSDIAKELLGLSDDIAKELESMDSTMAVWYVADIAKKRSTEDWMDIVKKCLGIAPSPKLVDSAVSPGISQWVSENVKYVKSIPQEMQSNLADIILWGYNTHQPLVNIYHRIEKQLAVSKSKSHVLARDQMGTLNAQLMRSEQEALGVKQYIWKTRRDNKVRDCHRSLNGKTFSWDNPPEMWYVTQHGIVYTGRRCNPGEDYCCRCTAIPIIDKEKAIERITRENV